MKGGLLRRAVKPLIPWGVPVVLVILWQVLGQIGWISSRTLPEPTAVVQAALRLAESGDLFRYIGDSTSRALLGLAIGGTIGLVLGFVNGLIPQRRNSWTQRSKCCATFPIWR